MYIAAELICISTLVDTIERVYSDILLFAHNYRIPSIKHLLIVAAVESVALHFNTPWGHPVDLHPWEVGE